MRIAIAVCPEIPVPPVDYGGTERQMDVLARGLAARGHEVLLLCGPGSTCSVQKVVTTAAAMSAEWEYVRWMREQDRWRTFDAMVDATANHVLSQDAGLPKEARTVALMLGDPTKKYPHNQVRNRVYCSLPFAEFCGCLGHPIVRNIVCERPEEVSIGDGSGGYVAYAGTIRPEKGLHVAARACRQLGVAFRVAGQVRNAYRPYWESFRSGVEYVGPLGDTDKYDLLRGAVATAYPVSWCDAGPLLVKESLLVGTPVVACPNGGLTEDVRQGRNGWLTGEQDFVTALATVLQTTWDRQEIREGILPALNVGIYLDAIESLCRRVAMGECW